MGTSTQRLLRRVAAREQIRSTAAQFHLYLLLLAAAYALLLLCSRLLALVPNWFVPVTLVTIAAAALALAVAFHARPTPARAARLVDARMHTHDLFLTAALIEAAVGEYKPLVLKRAEEQAGTIPASKAVPFDLAARARNMVVVMALLLAGVLFLPQLDPFGKEGDRRQAAERRRQLEQARRATAARIALLREKRPTAEVSEEVRRALEELKQTFGSMSPAQREANLKRLNMSQAALSEMWRKAGEERLRNAFRQARQSQRFGTGQGEKAASWREQLKKGDAAGLRKEIARLKEAAEKLARNADAAERRKLAAQIKSSLSQMSECAACTAGSTALDAALQQALSQLAESQTGAMSQEALQGLKGSLELAQLELESLAQSIRDMQALQDALESVQLAKLLNGLEPLDGQECSECRNIGDYAALYAKMMTGRCPQCGGKVGADGVCSSCGARGRGPGMRGPGTGVGGLAAEDTEAETGFKTEKSQSALTAGKILLSFTTRGLSDSGEAAVNYEKYLQDVKQGVGEAILHEQVPPAYHEAIRKYFDTIEEEAGESTAER